jgi:hypothetical protein
VISGLGSVIVEFERTHAYIIAKGSLETRSVPVVFPGVRLRSSLVRIVRISIEIPSTVVDSPDSDGFDPAVSDYVGDESDQRDGGDFEGFGEGHGWEMCQVSVD